jgi:hypothetical protein
LVDSPSSRGWAAAGEEVLRRTLFFFFITLDIGPQRPLSLALSDTNVYEPEMHAHMGTERKLTRGGMVMWAGGGGHVPLDS